MGPRPASRWRIGNDSQIFYVCAIVDNNQVVYKYYKNYKSGWCYRVDSLDIFSRVFSKVRYTNRPRVRSKQ